MKPVRLSLQKWLESLSPEEKKELALPAEMEMELVKVKEGVWVLTPASGASANPANTSTLASATPSHSTAPTLKPLHQKVLRLMQTHSASDLVEGRFEQFLSQEELLALQELVNSGRVERYKSSPKYSRGIYREARGNGMNASGTSATPLPHTPLIPAVPAEKPLEEYQLDKDGFEIIRNENAARQRSQELADKLKANEVKGMKSFDGFYYIIQTPQLERFMPTITQILQRQKKADLPALAKESGMPPILVRMVLEFAKEEGTIIEKRKDAFMYVG